MSARSPERRVVAIVGATATGKTAVAESVAAEIDAEIVCVDSRQVFRDLEIGTGKPSREERARRAHHLFDALALNEPPNAGWYAQAAAEVARAIHDRGHPVVLVGGTGLYLRALQSGLAPHPERSPETRSRLEARLAEVGVEALHAELAHHDPATAARLQPRDGQRILRALEVLETSGRTLSWWHARETLPALSADWFVFELVADPRHRADTIAERTRGMLASGLVDETRALVQRGEREALRSLRAIGYDEAMDVIAGHKSLSEAEEAINVRTRQLAKRQRTWFRHQTVGVRVECIRQNPDVAGGILRALAGAG